MEGHNKLADRVQGELEGHGIKYAGVHQKALSYPRGSAVTSSGSLWIALRDTREGEQPGKVPDAWQLAAKVRPAGVKREAGRMSAREEIVAACERTVAAFVRSSTVHLMSGSAS